MTVHLCYFSDNPRDTMSRVQATPREWNDLRYAMSLDGVICIDPAEYWGPHNDVVFVLDIDLAMTLHPNAMWVFCDAHEPTATDLKSFAHPVGDTVYCFGSDGKGFTGVDVSDGEWVKVPAATGREYWGIQAAAIVAYDR